MIELLVVTRLWVDNSCSAKRKKKIQTGAYWNSWVKY